MKKLFLLWLFFLLVYLFVAGRGKFDFKTTQRNFFSLQAYSWLNGRMDLVVLPKDTTDISFYNNKAYIYWPPLPSLLVLPFVKLFGINVSDVFYTAFWASLSPVLLYLILKKAKEIKFIPPLSDQYLLLLAFFFAFGTVHFYLSTLGTVWFTSQTLAIIPFLGSLVYLFQYVRSKKSADYILSILLLGLSFWGRSTLLLAIPLHLYILLRLCKNNGIRLLIFTIIFLLFDIGLFGVYNNYRFGNYFENGLNLQKFNPRWNNSTQTYGLTNIYYLPNNAFYFLVNPLVFIKDYPFIRPDPEGNSIFFTSPLFILLVGIISSSFLDKKFRQVHIIAFTGLILIAPMLLYYGTGWFQFGYRYVLDAIPLLILLLAQVIDKYSRILVIFLFAASVIINTLGTVWFQQISSFLHY